MLSDYLKQHSRKDHDSIENSIDLVKCATNPLIYTKMIKAFYGYYFPMEKVFDHFKNEFNEMGVDVKARHKIKLLEDDLRHLGLSDEEIKVLESCTEIPAITNIAEAMGALYVLEGSTLGGQIIFRQLGKAGILVNGEDRGRFFKSYGNETALMWSAFKESLNKIPESHNDVVLDKAKETFNTLENWLTKKVS